MRERWIFRWIYGRQIERERAREREREKYKYILYTYIYATGRLPPPALLATSVAPPPSIKLEKLPHIAKMIGKQRLHKHTLWGPRAGIICICI